MGKELHMAEEMYRICGKGSVRRNKGTWQAIISYEDVRTGKRRQRTRSTGVPCKSGSDAGRKRALEIAQEFRCDLAIELARASDEKRDIDLEKQRERDEFASISLGDALEKYIELCFSLKRITATTRDDYHYSALHIERDQLGRMGVAEVGTDDVNLWSVRKIDDGLAVETLHKSFQLASRMYGYLLKRSDNTLRCNPFEGAIKPQRREKPRNALRPELVPRLNMLTSMMPDGKFKRAVVIALHTGMRIGEICGLRWCDVDLERATITVRHSVAYARSVGSYIKDCKNHEMRTVPIDPIGLMPYLREIRQAAARELSGTRGRGEELAECYVLCEPGQEFATTSYLRRAFKTFSESNKLMGTNDEVITFHGLRHTFATQWIRHGGDIKSLQSILGHKDATVTLNVYADVDPLSKQHNMIMVSPNLWGGYLGLHIDPGPMFAQRVDEAKELLRAFGYRVEEPDDRAVEIRDAETVRRLYPLEYAAYMGAIPAEATVA